MDDIRIHFDKMSSNYDYYKFKNRYYYSNLKKLLANLIPQNQIVLEIGCGTGELLTFLKPKMGYGIDISPKMIELCKQKYGNLNNIHFYTKSVLAFKDKQIDYIFMSDVVEHVSDIDKIFKDVVSIMGKRTKFICTYANPKWEPLLMLAEKLKLKMPEGKHKRIKYEELQIIIESLGLKIVKHDYKLLVPINIPLLTNYANRYLENLFKKYALIEYFTAAKS